VLHVLDGGAGFRMTPRLPYDDMSERGRGLFIINELVDQFHVLRRSGGGSHASAVLRR
jgi:anti-sigma regulatory factor (Ser/Thr protein kinase)